MVWSQQEPSLDTCALARISHTTQFERVGWLSLGIRKEPPAWLTASPSVYVKHHQARIIRLSVELLSHLWYFLCKTQVQSKGKFMISGFTAPHVRTVMGPDGSSCCQTALVRKIRLVHKKYSLSYNVSFWSWTGLTTVLHWYHSDEHSLGFRGETSCARLVGSRHASDGSGCLILDVNVVSVALDVYNERH